MVARTILICVLVLSPVAGRFLCAGVFSQADWESDVPYKEAADRIRLLAKEGNLSALLSLGEQLHKDFAAKDVKKYGHVMLVLSQELGTLSLRGDKHLAAAQDFAMRALARADLLDLATECNLLGYVNRNIDAEGAKLSGEAWAALRKTQVEMHLHAWHRLEKSIDKDWDPEDVPSVNLRPPLETGLPSGAAPAAVKDPKLRAQYEAAIEANRRKAERYREQSQARKLKLHVLPRAERYIISAYSMAPTGEAELKELDGLLEKYGLDADQRARIPKAIRDRKADQDAASQPMTPPSERKGQE